MRVFRFLLTVLCLTPLAVWAGPVDINQADAATLAKELKGIGLSRAQAIVAHRQQHGPFKSPDELALVKGVGRKVIEQNRENIRTEAPSAASSAARPNAPPGPRR